MNAAHPLDALVCGLIAVLGCRGGTRGRLSSTHSIMLGVLVFPQRLWPLLEKREEGGRL